VDVVGDLLRLAEGVDAVGIWTWACRGGGMKMSWAIYSYL
jgi:hypothetical protein